MSSSFQPASDGPGGSRSAAESREQQVRRIGALVAAGLLGAACGLAALLSFPVLRNWGRLPVLTPERFQEARMLWQRAGPSNYDLTVKVAGRRAATYHTQVRDGAVAVSTHNGQPIRPRSRDTWSVPGMFATMQSDVDNLVRHQQGTADASTPQVHLRALFDPDCGLPLRYHRTELRRWGNNQEVSWEVVSFEVGPPSSGLPPPAK